VTPEFTEAPQQSITSHHHRTIQICYPSHRTRLYRIFWADNAETLHRIPHHRGSSLSQHTSLYHGSPTHQTRPVQGGFWFNCWWNNQLRCLSP